MRLAAYVLVADPFFLRRSVSAYYSLVDRIVLSYDRSGRSWTGTPLPLDECMAILRDIDTDRKFVHAPGDYARSGFAPMANETFQRQCALDSASETGDWVLQLDTDEVLPRPSRFAEAVSRADEAGAGAMDYPARWIYTRVGPGMYLESSNRFGRRVASYPGPLAVRAGTSLRMARQTDAVHYRADIRAKNTDPWRPADSAVHEVVHPRDAVLHFSWVRTPEAVHRKLAWSGHADDLDAPAEYRQWVWHTRHPILTTVSNPLRRGRWLRLTSVPEPPGCTASEASL